MSVEQIYMVIGKVGCTAKENLPDCFGGGTAVMSC